MPHHMNNRTHSHDSDPRPCTTVPLSPCVNKLDSSPLGPVSPILLSSSSFPALLYLLGPLSSFLSYCVMILIGATGHVRNAHVL